MVHNEAEFIATADAIRGRHNVNEEFHLSNLFRTENVTTLAEATRGLDILINKAGAAQSGNMSEIVEATWRKAWYLKLFGYINMMGAVDPAMEARNSGVIVSTVQNPHETGIITLGQNITFGAEQQEPRQGNRLLAVLIEIVNLRVKDPLLGAVVNLTQIRDAAEPLSVYGFLP